MIMEKMDILQKPTEIRSKSLQNLGFLNYLTAGRDTLYLSNMPSLKRIMPLWVRNEEIFDEYKVCTKLLSSFRHAEKGNFNCMKWFANGKKLITGLSSGPSGEILVINVNNFQKDPLFKPVKTENAARALAFTHNEKMILCGDNKGRILYFDLNLRDLTLEKPAKSDDNEAFKEISVAPTDLKFVTCAEDKVLKIWDLPSKTTESEKNGHGNDITSCEWHPFQSLIASASKDHSIKLWCPRSKEELATIRKHKNNVNKIRWNKNGNWLLSCSKDQLCKIFDIRKIEEEIGSYKNTLEMNSVAWNPIDERLFASADNEGNIIYWQTDENSPIQNCSKPDSTKATVYDLSWNAAGQVLAGLGKDKRIDFWGMSTVFNTKLRLKDEGLFKPQQAMQHPFMTKQL